MTTTPDYALVLKKDCPTCTLLAPLLPQLEAGLNGPLHVYVQDDPAFPGNVSNAIDDSELEFSYRNDIEVVPTLIRLEDHQHSRIFGWDREQWRSFTGIADLGADLSPFKPGCGSRTQDPGMPEQLALRYDRDKLQARQVALAEAEDSIEACFERGWSDGLPVVPPTPLRVLRMLQATDLSPDTIIGVVPPDNVECSVEKLAINAVMAGCKPEYFPVVIAALRGALQDAFCVHGLLCTTYFSGPVLIVNGPVSRHIGMNSGINVFGQGNRANSTIGRALQLLIRNVGGGAPGGIDRATMGTPAKLGFSFAEDESDASWPSLAMDRGFDRGQSVVNLFAGDGIIPIVDQHSRTAESLTKSFAATMLTMVNKKLFGMADAVLVVCPEHRRLLKECGWNKDDLRNALTEELKAPGAELIQGAGGMQEGLPAALKDKTLNKFRKDGLHIASAGGTAGMFSAVIGGWVASGERGSQLVSQEVEQAQ